jgi:outer membrane protein OmpU
MDMIEIGVGYAPKGGSTSAQGGVTGLGGTASSTSAFIKIDPMDGLEIGFGVGEYTAAGGGDANLTDDVDTAYVSYVYGPVTFAYQVSNTDTNDTTSATADDEQTKFGILYAVNDEMSISYQDIENEDSTTSVDEEATGVSMSYTVGSMTFKAHRNKGTNLGNAVTNESEHTEVGVSFAF